MNSKKLLNSYCINFDDDYKKMIDILAETYQRKPAELLRLLLIPVLHDKYINLISDSNNNAEMNQAIFKKFY